MNGGEGPYQDPSGLGIHWTGSAGSYSHFLCAVPSVVNGYEYLTTTSSEMDFEISPETETVRISLWCQAQTFDYPGANLLVYLTDDSPCYSQGLGDYGISNAFDNNFYVAESPTGVATLHCNFEESLLLCNSIKTSSVMHSTFTGLSAVKEGSFTPDAPIC